MRLVHWPSLQPDVRTGGGVAVQAITALLKLAPSTATLQVRDAQGHVVSEEEVPSALIQRGDLLKVRALCLRLAASRWLPSLPPGIPACADEHTWLHPPRLSLLYRRACIPE